MESLSLTVMVYLPNESVMTPLPEVLTTLTASNGLVLFILYTVPLMVICEKADCPTNNREAKSAENKSFDKDGCKGKKIEP